MRHAPSIRNSMDMQARQDFLYFQRLSISDGTIEALKWLALLAMTCSHINYALFPSNQLPVLIEFGCIAFPLFGFVLAYNLARPNALQHGAYQRAIIKMLLFGVIATPFYILATPIFVTGWLPLNMLFTLATATGIVALIEQGQLIHVMLAIALFLLGSAFVNGYWVCTGYCVAAWYFCKKPSALSFALWLVSTLGLSLIYPTFWGLAAIPVIMITTKVDFKLPRLRWIFYAYYPLHFAVLLIIRLLMEVPVNGF